MWLLIAKAGFTDVWTCSLVASLWLCEGCWFGSGWLIEADWLHGSVTWCYLWLLKSPMGTGVSRSHQSGGLMDFFQFGEQPWIKTSTSVGFDVMVRVLVLPLILSQILLYVDAVYIILLILVYVIILLMSPELYTRTIPLQILRNPIFRYYSGSNMKSCSSVTSWSSNSNQVELFWERLTRSCLSKQASTTIWLRRVIG